LEVASKLDPKVLRLSRQIGRQIRAAREAEGLSQNAVSKRIGMSHTNYARIEYGKTNVTIESMLKIAEGLGMKLRIEFE
jgi:transcriptional regulator with XRE-family HTH domain